MESEKISVCIITKNECDKLEDCLNHLLPYTKKAGHEIVVVDTGSTDNTVEMCKKYTDSIYHFKWVDDFSAARNYAAKMAKNDWILAIDSDENVTEWDENVLQNVINKSDNIVGSINIVNTCGFGRDMYQEKSILFRLYNKMINTFKFSVHEQILPIKSNISFDEKEIEKHIDITIFHNSYSGTKEDLLPKAQRNIKLLEKELKQKPNDAFTLYNLGQSYYMIEDFDKALEYYSKGLEQDVNPTRDWVKNMVVSYGYCLLNLNQNEKALELEGLYDTFCEYADFVFLIGYTYMKNGFFDDAIKQFEIATTKTDYSVLGSNSYRAWYNIGVIYECAGYKDKAKEYYLKCGDYDMAKQRLNG